jgi:hypothetical protein
MITLYQLEYTDEMIEYLNGPGGGWSNAIKKYELIEADQNMRLGAERWENRFWKHYKAVAEIKAEDLDDGWIIGNNDHHEMVKEGSLKPLLPYIASKRTGRAKTYMMVNMHSMSVGNICKMNEEYFICNRTGWKKVKIETEHAKN